MLEMFERLINEHGSSAILKERIELISDKYSVLEDKLDVSTQRNTALEEENESLRKQLNQAAQEIEHLQKIIKINIESQESNELDEVKERILIALFESNSDARVSQLAQHLGMEEGLIQYHIDHLKGLDFIDYGPLRINSPIGYMLTKSGRKHVVEAIGI